MSIPIEDHELIRSINVNEHYVTINYNNWFNKIKAGHFLHVPLLNIQNVLGNQFNRENLVSFYANPDFDNVTKFLASMVWGYAAPAGGQAAGYGPHRVSQMFIDPRASAAAINLVGIQNDNEIINSYKILDNTLKMCGPNFFTKHFYFLGKSFGINQYPLIFDDRVAAGLVKVNVPPENHPPLLNMIRVSATRNKSSYINYLKYAWIEANSIGCNPDQIEYDLFNL